MKNLYKALSLIAVFSSTTLHGAMASDYYDISEFKVQEVVPTAEELYSELIQPREIQEPELHSIDWSQLVLLGEKLIEIIKSGRPVGNVRRDAVAVVPSGIQAWDRLTGWKSPVTKVYGIIAKNKLGVTVIDLRLKVSAMYGGSLNGKGRYLANVIVVPSSISIAWGFNCDVWTENRNPINMGTSANPVAGLGFDIRFRYGSALKEMIGAQDYFVTGDGLIKEVR